MSVRWSVPPPMATYRDACDLRKRAAQGVWRQATGERPEVPPSRAGGEFGAESRVGAPADRIQIDQPRRTLVQRR